MPHSDPLHPPPPLPVSKRLRRAAAVEISFESLFAVALIAAVIAALNAAELSAQSTAVFAGAQSLVPLSYGIYPVSVAVDASGNVYVADWANDQVVKAGWAGGAFALSVVANGPSNGISCPAGVAVDAGGNVYIADSCAMEVLMETPNGASYTQTVVASQSANSLDAPDGVAVDGVGNVYIADEGNGRVLKETLSGSAYTQSVVAGGLLGPRAVAVDAGANVYIADVNPTSTSSQVLKESLESGSYTQSVLANRINNGLIAPIGVAIDASGNVYIADSGNDDVLIETPNGGAYAQIVLASAANGLATPVSLAVDWSGSVYIADSGNGDVVKVQPAVANLGMVPARSKSWVDQLTFTFNSAISLSGTAPYRVLAMGVPGQEFSDAGTGSCTAGTSYQAGSSCTVDVIFAPGLAGTRNGAVVLEGSSGNTLATALMSGIGTGPQMVHFGGFGVIAAAHLGQVSDVAVDSAGDVYVVDEGSAILNAPANVYKINPGANLKLPIGAGWQLPVAMALDGAGDVYVSDYEQAAVFKVAPNGAESKVPIAVKGPIGLALDGAGNLFVADSSGNAVYKMTPGGTVTSVGSNWSTPNYLAVDTLGNLYVGEFFSASVSMVTPAGVQTLLTGALQYPEGIKVDAAGVIYVASGSATDQTIYQLTQSGTVTALITQTGMPYPKGLALDMSGNLYIADSNAGEDLPSALIYELDRSDALPTFTFPTETLVETRDEIDSTKTVTFQNIGNQPLVLDSPGAGSNPSYPASFPANIADTNLCTPSSLLAPGATCDVSFYFGPVIAGPVSEAVLLADNSLNRPGGAQSVAVSGTSIGKSQTIAFTQPAGPVSYGVAPIALKAISTSGLTANFSVLSGPGVVRGNLLAVTGVGTITVAASQSGGGIYIAAAEVTRSITVRKAAQSIAFAAPKTPVGYGEKPIVLSAKATSRLTVIFSVVSGPARVKGSTLTITGAGTVVVAAGQAGDSNYDAAAEVKRSIVVEKARLTVTANHMSMKQGAKVPKLTCRMAGFVDGGAHKSAITGLPKLTTTATSKSAAGKYPITVSAGNLTARSYSFTYVSGTLTIDK
jgi:sugar lactone lactonase YvrE